jgi:hypothetical protein
MMIKFLLVLIVLVLCGPAGLLDWQQVRHFLEHVSAVIQSIILGMQAWGLGT